MAKYGSTDLASSWSWSGDGSPLSFNQIYDNNTGTIGGVTSPSAPDYIVTDLGSAKAAGKFRLWNDDPYGLNQFDVQYSDNGSDWYDMQTGFTATRSKVAWQEFTFNNGGAKHRYWRIKCTAYYDGGLLIAEIELLEIFITGGAFLLFLSEAWQKHKKLWTPEHKLILPKDLGFSY